MSLNQSHFLKFLALVLIGAAIVWSCSMNPYKDDVIGKWETTEWLIGPDMTPRTDFKMDFDFKADGTYHIDYGGEQEEGTYWVEGYNLYTTETGQVEKRVKITSLKDGVMKIEMNRSGRAEQLTLKKAS